MFSKWPKVICDPLHHLISFGDNKYDKLLLSLINTREFQRLRRIKQLGMSELVFPGANHSRFAHSIGVMQMARKFLDRLADVCSHDTKPTEEQRIIVLVAALLHDLGHGPFSHAFEKITKLDHEKWTELIIKDPSTEVNKRLVAYDPALPDKVVMFFDEEVNEEEREAHGVSTHLTQIVSSQLDADRFDYLLRDSYAAGTTTGQFEYAYLIQNMFLDEQYGRLVVGRKALMAAEAYVFARYRMYQTVYYHKTTRSAEVMLKLLFTRLKELLNSEGEERFRSMIAPDAPPRLFTAFAGEINLEDYIALDDATVTEFFKCAAKSPDKYMQSLGSGILDRCLYKARQVSSSDYEPNKSFAKRAAAAMKDIGLDPEFALVEDLASDTPYKQYDPSSGKPSKVIYVEDNKGDIKEISELSNSVNQLVHKSTLMRYYYPEEVQNIVDEAAEALQRGTA